MRSPWPLLLLVGCTERLPLTELPVLGGTAEQQGRLLEELEGFAEQIGPDRVALRGVRILDELKGGVAGRYNGTSKWIDINANNPSITVVLRHELCHAVDHADRLTDRPDPVMDEHARALFTDTFYATKRDTYPTKRKQRGEAFADVCELGPLALSALRDAPCDEEPERVAELAAWVLDRVYTEYEAPPPLPVADDAVVTLGAWPPGDVRVRPTFTPGAVVVREPGDAPEWVEYADLYTGALTGEVHGEWTELADPPSARGIAAERRAGRADGPAAVAGTIPVDPWVTGYRTFSWDPEHGDYRRLDEACEERDRDRLFVADEQVWRHWTDGTLVRWQPISP